MATRRHTTDGLTADHVLHGLLTTDDFFADDATTNGLTTDILATHAASHPVRTT